MFVCRYVNMNVVIPGGQEGGVQCHGAGATGACELPDVGAGNHTWFFCKSGMCYCF